MIRPLGSLVYSYRWLQSNMSMHMFHVYVHVAPGIRRLGFEAGKLVVEGSNRVDLHVPSEVFHPNRFIMRPVWVMEAWEILTSKILPIMSITQSVDNLWEICFPTKIHKAEWLTVFFQRNLDQLRGPVEKPFEGTRGGCWALVHHFACGREGFWHCYPAIPSGTLNCRKEVLGLEARVLAHPQFSSASVSDHATLLPMQGFRLGPDHLST